jgi:tetratricopeptide (TPR) repeat protein
LLSDLKKSEMNDLLLLQKLLEKVENKNPSEYLISDEPILFNIALLMNQKLDYKKALPYLEIASSLNPNREATWFSMAQIYDILGDYNKSISSYEKTILLAKSRDVISASYSNAINLLLKENRLSEAAKMSDDAINHDPESDINWINAGNVSFLNIYIYIYIYHI